MRFVSRKVFVGSAMAGASAIAAAMVAIMGVIPSASASAGGRYVLKLDSSSAGRAPSLWTVSAELHAGDGTTVYTWHETHAGRSDLVRWDYTDGGDGGWINLHIRTTRSPNQDFLKLPLGEDHCFGLNADLVTSQVPC